MDTSERFDIAVIGGGINGAGIAADAAGRGLKVCLIEQGDLAGATSSASSKLIHGGLRYLEHYEFSLVREALQERERLMHAAPHLIWPLRFVLPHVDGMRPRWLLRAGLFLYDHLSSRKVLPASRSVRFKSDVSGPYLKAELTRGFSYWDCWVDDARLVVLNARAAAQKGAVIQTRARVTRYQPSPEAPNLWQVHIQSGETTSRITARALVNAAGPWVDRVGALETQRDGAPIEPSIPKVRLVKGSHVWLRGRRSGDDGLILQNRDGRVVFVLPFGTSFTLIGTTDVPVEGDPGDARCSSDEQAYLLAAASRFLAKTVTPEDVVGSFSGVRPLYDDQESDPSKVTRDYRLDLRRSANAPPLLTVLGGKITTYRRLAEEAVDQLVAFFPNAGPKWTAHQTLPGGALAGDVADFKRRLFAHYPNLDQGLVSGIADRHGVLAYDVLGDARNMDDLGQMFMPGLCAREVTYMRDIEWAKTADDVLWRRTKFGLALSASDSEEIVEMIEGCLELKTLL